MVDVDPIGLDAETGQGVALGSEVLLIGGASGVPDKQRALASVTAAPVGGNTGWYDCLVSDSTSATASSARNGILEWDVCPLGCPYLREGF